MTLNQFVYLVTRPFGSLEISKFLSRNHPKILMYHRITNDFGSEGLTARKFRAQAKIIKKDFVPMTLRDLLAAHEHGCVPKNAVVITFDDGYADFADVAFPILQSEGIPATLFITAGFINGDVWLWPDKIHYLIDLSRHEDLVNSEILPKEILICDDKNKNWNSICDYCLSINNEKIDELICDIEKVSGLRLPKVSPDRYKALSWEKLRMLVAAGVDIGNHSLTHPILTKVDEYKLVEEISLSKDLIKNNLSIDPKVFCYPNGQCNDFNKLVKSKLEEFGYEYGIAAFPGRNPLANRFEIRRYSINGSKDGFLKTIYGLSYLSLIKKDDRYILESM